MLTLRLRDLEASGVVRRRRLPAPASSNVYELTEWGAELEPIVLGLQRWGAGSPTLPHDVPVGCDAAMLALKNAFDPEAAADLSVTAEVRFPTGTFRLAVDDGTIDIRRGPADDAELVVETDPPTLEQVAFGLRSFRDAERGGDLTVHGDRKQAQRLLALFAVAFATAAS
jgi:hypothetical protein